MIYKMEDILVQIIMKILKKYLEKSGNIIATHDRWTNSSKPSNCIKLLYAKYFKNETIMIQKAKILNDSHPIL